MREAGLYIAVLGIDGTGKTTMTRMLADELKRSGHEAKVLSWREELELAERPNTRESLRQLWVESLRLVHLGVDLPPAPASYDEFHSQQWEKRYAGSKFSTNVPGGPLAAAWLEWVGQTLLMHEIVNPHRARGVHVIDESFSLKMAYKELLIADLLNDDPAVAAEIGRAREIITELFKSTAPDVGIVISSSSVDQAYRWRIRQEGALGSLEDLGAAAGARGRDGFVRLQQECDSFFRRFARQPNWVVLEMQDAAPPVNFARLRELLAGHPAIGSLLHDS
ncbi:hypothetical protein AB0O28_27510 [Microbispora sp. NPDC088329]|uniref:hypothetical protein n=1 Tax=Microbispora sp. NPDC088329 TaxID=3154869 RepID=UPI003444CC49